MARARDNSSAAPDPVHIKDLVADPRNRRRHNPRNVGLISESLQRNGFARSIVINEDNTILAGNATVEAAAEVGITKVRVVEARGDEVIAVRRRGLTAAQQRELAIVDNRASELAEWDTEQLARDVDEGLDLSFAFRGDELSTLLAVEVPAEADAPVEQPAGDDVYQEQYGVIVVCGSEEQQEAVYKELTAAGHTCKVVTT